MVFSRAILVALILLLAMPAVAEPRSASADKLPPDIERELALPEDKIDIGEAALIFAREIFPDQVDVIADSVELDRLADEARQLMPANATTDQAILALAEVIYHREGYHYDVPDGPPVPFSMPSSDKAENYFLPATLQLKHGACVTLPMLFLAVAQRLHLPVYPANGPAHNYLKITDPYARIRNWEATSGGPARDVWIIEQENIPAAGIERGTYMRTLSYHEYLADLLAFNGHYYEQMGLWDTAALYFKRALQINPNNDYAAIELATNYTKKFLYLIWSNDPDRAWPALAQAQTYINRFAAMGGDFSAYEDSSQPGEGNAYEQFFDSRPPDKLSLAYKN